MKNIFKKLFNKTEETKNKGINSNNEDVGFVKPKPGLSKTVTKESKSEPKINKNPIDNIIDWVDKPKSKKIKNKPKVESNPRITSKYERHPNNMEDESNIIKNFERSFGTQISDEKLENVGFINETRNFYEYQKNKVKIHLYKNEHYSKRQINWNYEILDLEKRKVTQKGKLNYMVDVVDLINLI
jgi:hypothetical protein